MTSLHCALDSVVHGKLSDDRLFLFTQVNELQTQIIAPIADFPDPDNDCVHLHARFAVGYLDADVGSGGNSLPAESHAGFGEIQHFPQVALEECVLSYSRV